MHSHLKLWRPLLVALLFFSGNVLADSYTATYQYALYSIPSAGPFSTPKPACDYYANTVQYAMYGTVTQTSWQIISCDVYGGSNNRLASSAISPINGTCPYGGTIVSAPTCSNAPSCPTGQNRNTISGACQTPPTCSTGSTYDQGSNTCTPVVCPTNQTFQATAQNPTGGCMPIPQTCDALNTQICSDTQVMCIGASGYLQVKNLVRCSAYPCTAPQIANSTNDGCIAPPVWGCPAGQHANSTNNGCVADDPTACPANTRHGYINGVSQCVPIPRDAPDNAASTPPDGSIPPAPTINTGNGTVNETVVQKDSNGNITGTQAITGTTKIDLNTTGLAQDSSLKAINDSLNKTSSKTAWNKSAPGVAPSDSNADTITSKKQQIATLFSTIRAEFSGLTPTFSSSGSLSCDPIQIPQLNVSFRLCLSDYPDLLTNTGNAFYVLSLILALIIILG